jgi:hypothetical protein
MIFTLIFGVFYFFVSIGLLYRFFTQGSLTGHLYKNERYRWMISVADLTVTALIILSGISAIFGIEIFWGIISFCLYFYFTILSIRGVLTGEALIFSRRTQITRYTGKKARLFSWEILFAHLIAVPFILIGLVAALWRLFHLPM